MHFTGVGMSFAFDFWRVDKNVYFSKVSKTWNWRIENSHYTKVHASKHIKKFEDACARKKAAKGDGSLLKEIEYIKNNVSVFVSSFNV